MRLVRQLVLGALLGAAFGLAGAAMVETADEQGDCPDVTQGP